MFTEEITKKSGGSDLDCYVIVVDDSSLGGGNTLHVSESWTPGCVLGGGHKKRRDLLSLWTHFNKNLIRQGDRFILK